MNRLPSDTNRKELADSLTKHGYIPVGLIPLSKIMSEVRPLTP